MAKKLPISLNDIDEKEINDVVELLGISKGYGSAPTAIKFSVSLTRHYLLSILQLIPDLPPDKLDLLLSSVAKLKKERYQAKIDKIKELTS